MTGFLILKTFPNIKITIEHEAALDPVFANRISNPKIDRRAF